MKSNTDSKFFNRYGALRRKYQVLGGICGFARENNGAMPSVRVLAKYLDMGKTTVVLYLRELESEELITWVEGRLVVIDATWNPPPSVEMLVELSA